MLVLAVVIFAIALVAFRADGVATSRTRAYAGAFALVFLVGVAAQHFLGRRPAAESSAVTASDGNGAISTTVEGIKGIVTAGALDGANVNDSRALHIRGWALTAKNKPAGTLVAIVDRSKYVDITKMYGRPRPDVAASLKNPADRDSGYEGDVPLADLPGGAHTIQIAVSADGRKTMQYPANSTRQFSLP